MVAGWFVKPMRHRVWIPRAPMSRAWGVYLPSPINTATFRPASETVIHQNGICPQRLRASPKGPKLDRERERDGGEMDPSSKSDAGSEPGQGGEVQHPEHQNPTPKPPVPVGQVNQEHPELYMEALARYPNDESIDAADEKRLVRKLDMRLLPLLGICYFFYYVDKTTLSYAAIFGLKDGLGLKGEEYAWLSSSFYFGWLIWAIPSNLIMQRYPPAYYLAFNIFMWGALLMAQAAAQDFAGLLVLRVLSGAFEAIADPAFMLVTSMYYTRAEQPSRISAWYAWNGVGVAGGGLIGYAIGHVEGALASWRYEFLIVGAFCAAWAIVLALLLPNSPRSIWGFSRDERLIMIARMRRNQTGVEQRRINWAQIREAYTDYKTWLFTLLGFVANIPNGGISNFSTLVIQGLGFDTFETALLGIPQGALVVIWIGLGALANRFMPNNCRTLVCAMFMIPTIAGALGFLLAPPDAYVGRLICFLVRHLSVPHHVQHGRPIQEDDRVWHDMVRRLHRQHHQPVLLQVGPGAQVPPRDRVAPRGQLRRARPVLCVPLRLRLGEQEEGAPAPGAT
ncbi:hypothetical protein RB595_008831 [Gaeumannomyces hyphopodioides]